jgi:hypothetical protein
MPSINFVKLFYLVPIQRQYKLERLFLAALVEIFYYLKIWKTLELK